MKNQTPRIQVYESHQRARNFPIGVVFVGASCRLGRTGRAVGVDEGEKSRTSPCKKSLKPNQSKEILSFSVGVRSQESQAGQKHLFPARKKNWGA